MTEPSTPSVTAVYTAKAAEELAAADREAPGADRIPWSGDPLGHVVLVKGMPGPAEESGGAALSGADGDAAAAALAALGFDPARVFSTVSRPTGGDSEALLRRLRAQIEAVDPASIIALDRTAAADVAAVLGTGELVAGRPVCAAGRSVLAVDGLEASLDDEVLKRRVWAQLKQLAPAGPVW